MSSKTRNGQAGKLQRVQVSCLTCQQETWHEVVVEVAKTFADDESGFWFGEEHQVVRCCGCECHSFRTTYQDASSNPSDPVSETLWPPRDQKRAFLKDWSRLPNSIARIYRETNTAVSSGQPVLAAVGIRALVEAVCKHRRAKGRNLKQRINNLADRGVVTKTQARVLHKTRFLGNKAAHETVPADGKVLDAAMQVAEHMLTSVYLLPKIAKAIGGKQRMVRPSMKP